MSTSIAAPFVSYAQNFEDVMLWRALGHVERGRYVDVGAQHPVVLSTSRAFYERGWRGLHVEPVAAYAELLRSNRPDEIVLQVAVAERQGIVTIHEFPDTGLSTLDADIAERHRRAGYGARESTVPMVTLDAVLDQCAGSEIHWLKIDVEGYERQVIRGWKRAVGLPWVVVVESTAPLTRDDTSAAWEPMLLAKGYQRAYFDGLNRFYVAKGHEALLVAFREPPNVFDNFALTAASTFAQKLAGDIFELEHRVADREAALAGARDHARSSAEESRSAQHEARRAQEEAQRVQEDAERAREEAHRAQEDARRAREEAAVALQKSQADHEAALALREQAAQAQLRYASSEAHRDRLMQALDVALGELARAREAGTAQAAQVDALQQRVEDLHHRHEIAGAELLATQKRLGDIGRELTESHANVLFLRHAHAEAARQAASASSAHLVMRAAYESIRDSRSWRFTAPLRVLFGAVRRFGSASGAEARRIATLPRRALKRLLLAALSHVRAHPGRKAALASIVGGSRWLDSRLRRFAAANPATARQAVTPDPPQPFRAPESGAASAPPEEAPVAADAPVGSEHIARELRAALSNWPLGARRNV